MKTWSYPALLALGIGALVAGLGAGLGTGRHFTRERKPPPAVNPHTRATRLGGIAESNRDSSARDPARKTAAVTGTYLGFLEYLAGAAVDELPAIHVELTGADLGDKHDRFRALWERWAELDGPGGYEFARSIPDTGKDRQVVWEYLTRWSLTNPDAAIAEAMNLDDRDRCIAVSWIFRSLSQRNPARFFLTPDEKEWRHADDIPYTRGDAASHWGEIDPAAAVAHAGRIQENLRVEFAAGVANGWARRDPLRHWRGCGR